MVEEKRVYQVQWTNQYKKDVKLAKKRNFKMEELYSVVEKLANDEPLEERYHEQEHIQIYLENKQKGGSLPLRSHFVAPYPLA